MRAAGSTTARPLVVLGRLVDLVLIVLILIGLTSVVLGRILPALGHPVFVVGGLVAASAGTYLWLTSGGDDDPGQTVSSRSPFFGRARELGALAAPIAGSGRVVTIVGPPGIGKTRLAREHAAAAEPAAVFVDLAPAAEERHWMGHRPCTPDSLPLVGPVASRKGLWLATGHGHLGLTGAVNTALALADAILVGSPALTPAIA